MDMEQFLRSEPLLGDGALKKLSRAHIAVFGIGGVGSYTAEALARCGIGELTLVDNDTVAKSNINRQLIALHSTVGRLKAQVAEERLKDINPCIKTHPVTEFFTAENADSIDFDSFDYVVDAIDTISSKLALAQICCDKGIPLISSMGTGNKLDATRFEVADIFKTTVCPLARVMRRELKKMGIKKLKVVYSTEMPKQHEPVQEQADNARKSIPASVSFVPGVAGMIIAGEVIKDITFSKN